MPYSIAIAGTTKRTTLCAQTLFNHPNFDLSFIITPTAKAIGRKQILTKNPLENFANSNQIPTVIIKNKVDEEVKNEVLAHKKPDFLLVVDFGYLVPNWLLELPQIMPLNIHPSALPRWRGSSPGQFVLLHGETHSAVSMIKMTADFDQGPIVWQQSFTVDQNWTQIEYYQHSFELINQHLAQIIIKIAQNKIELIPQPIQSPTKIAYKIKKTDAFVSWTKISQAINSDSKIAIEIERACRAYSPWPLLWTEVETTKEKRRMQIIKTKLDPKTGLLILEKVKLEGMAEKPWREVKNAIKN